MKKNTTFEKKWAFDELSEIKLTNEMATLVVGVSDSTEVRLEGEIGFDPEQEDFDIADYLEDNFSGEVLRLELLELPSGSDFKATQLKLFVPSNVMLSIETENFPLSINGLTSKLKLEVENSPVSIKNCEGDIHLESENGPVKLHQITGNIFAKMENGPISAEAISGEGLHIESENGPIKLRLASYKKVIVETENGPIHYETLPVEGGDFSFKTENGIVHLVLPLSFSFKLSAESESGRLKSKLDAEVTQEDNTFRITNIFDDEEPTIIKIETENGLIKLSSDGHINLDYIKVKLDQMKDAVKQAATGEEKEKVKELLDKVADYLSRAAKSINEEKIRDKVTEAIDKMKAAAADFDFEETKATVTAKIDDLSTEIYSGMKDGLRNVKAEFDGLKYEHLNADSLKEYINKVVNSPLIKPYLGAEKKRQETEEIAERSRLKILDMLEAGKITSEEAERLLNAIRKE
jgi:DUF4097 and DUF4098 domain-containing protein YvlB